MSDEHRDKLSEIIGDEEFVEVKEVDTKGFGGFTPKGEDKEVNLKIKNAEIDKLIKQYKKINKFRKSNLYQVAKMDGKDTYVEKLVNDFGIDSEAIE